MSELNLQQITDRLNNMFDGDTRKIVFWYDDHADFADEINEVVPDNAKVHVLRPDNQFYTKYLLEREDTDSNYLIYAPFPKPDVRSNHLEDTLLYSMRFYADRASLLCVELHIDDKYKPVVEKHINFFGSKDRRKSFYNLKIDNYNEETILTGIICAICKTGICSFEEAMRVILTKSNIDDNKYLSDIDKYDLTDEFWRLCEHHFGYTDDKPNLTKLLITMFVTYTGKSVHSNLPKNWDAFRSVKSGNVITFLDSLMNNVKYNKKYDELSDCIAGKLDAETVLRDMAVEDISDCDTFRIIDDIVIRYLTDRLTSEDIGAALNGQNIPEICDSRMKMHFSGEYKNMYLTLKSAYCLIAAANYRAPDGLKNIVKAYKDKDFTIDSEYRHFYFYFTESNSPVIFENLRTLVENIYTNKYLSVLMPKWNKYINEVAEYIELPLQRDFFTSFVKPTMDKERTVVIISDALRYEVGHELYRRLEDDPKCKAKMKVMLGVLPSYTHLGMAALLPHDTLTITADEKVLADNILCDSIKSRQTVLQKHCEKGVCVQFDDVKSANQATLRSIFTSKDVIYIYHNQIDAIGDKGGTVKKTFKACADTIDEIMDLIHRISSNANTTRFIVTADHGFIYRQDTIKESDKIDVPSNITFARHRFIVSKKPYRADGVQSVQLDRVLRNDDKKFVSFPVNSNVFKISGGNPNFVHGGSSPQELILPVIEIKTEKGRIETKPARIELVSSVDKITNLIISLVFFQPEPVTDTVKAATYHVYFEEEGKERISNENVIVADERDSDSSKRITTLHFSFKNQKYDKTKTYNLVICNENDGVQILKKPVIMDLAFGDDYGF